VLVWGFVVLGAISISRFILLLCGIVVNDAQGKEFERADVSAVADKINIPRRYCYDYDVGAVRRFVPEYRCNYVHFAHSHRSVPQIMHAFVFLSFFY
jgi:hypothetical protein